MPSTRGAIRFLHRGRVRELAEEPATRTALDWLRETEGLTGTKECCAEGDCGACTVLLGRAEAGAVRYEAINACIAFLGMLDGRHLVTVEDLPAPDGTLTPVQQAMVECHASQCGFCTPGIVMALTALRHGSASASARDVEVALQGNLCRCTGYQPTVEAGARMYELTGPPVLTVIEPGELEALEDGASVRVGGFVQPASLDALAEILQATPEATIVAGAIDIGLWVTKGLRDTTPMVHIRRVAALRAIDEDPDRLRLGAGSSYARAGPALVPLAPGLEALLARIGGAQVRNAGTIGGNIANGSPIGDMPPPLIALGARLELHRGGETRELPLEDFFLDYGRQDLAPGEFVTAVTIPRLKPGTQFAVYKISKRRDEDISALCGVSRIDLVDGVVVEARIAFGGMAATPKRAAGAEAALRGRSWDETALDAAIAALAGDYAPIDDWRASGAYRSRVAGNLLRHFFAEATDPATPARLAHV